MRAVQLVEVGKPLELREITTPQPGPGEIRVRVLAARICHSDAHYRAGVAQARLEFAGIPETQTQAVALLAAQGCAAW
jgi:propanol-preferring alcohol dehydrogenase